MQAFTKEEVAPPVQPNPRGANDWQCPNESCINHLKMVFGRHVNCPSCNAPRTMPEWYAKEELIPDRANDWQCPNEGCINHSKMVFGRHTSCPSCGTARNATKAGDWLCPNTSCINSKNLVFARNTHCPNCGSPKPMTKGPMTVPRQHVLQFPPMMPTLFCPPAPTVSGKGCKGVNGDWKCPNPSCVNHVRMVFGKNMLCPQCGSPKSIPMPVMQVAMGKGSQGDWQCPKPDCVNHVRMVFGKHDNCPQCGSDKLPQVRWDAAQEPFPEVFGRPGDWQCPNSECINHRKLVFAKNTECPKCGSPPVEALRTVPARGDGRSRSPYR